MKKLLLIFILIPFTGLSQVQIGQDINGEMEFDESGFSVALSDDGSIVAIGAKGNDGNGNNSGHVRVFENISGVWTQIGQDIDGEAADDLFGSSVAISSDGTIVAIGATSNDDNGHVRVFENISGVWTQIGQDLDGEASIDFFGDEVALSSNGDILAVGAFGNNGNGNNSGHVRVFENIANTWIQVGQDIDGEAADDNSGQSISLSFDGTILAIGATANDGNGNNSGHVRVFENTNGVWSQIGQDINGEAEGDNSGSSVDLSFNGDILAIGAVRNDGNGNNSGHVRVFENISGVWTQIGLDIDGTSAGEGLGANLSLSQNGDIIVIGTPNSANNGALTGEVKVFQNINNVWTQVGSDIIGAVPGGNFSKGLSMSSDGNVIAIGAPRYNENGNDSGTVKVYDLAALLSTEEYTLTDFKLYPNPAKNLFTVQLENPSDLQNVNIYNKLGQFVLTSKETTIDTSTLAAGLYVVDIETTKGKGSKKLIIE
ncbi:MAG: hypothetical protein Tsb0033_00610 [Winogradskyella sp.]